MELVTIIIPAHNETATAGKVVKDLLRLKLKLQIVLVDDGSDDGTASSVQRAARGKVKVIKNKRRRGKGFAIRKALAKARGEVVVIQDGDYEYRPADLLRIVKPLLDGEADMVYGSRFKGKMAGMSPSHYVANRLLAMVASLLYLTPISDEATCYKAFRSEWLKKIKLRANGFDFCPEVTARLLKRGARYREVPISYFARTKEEGKKVRFRDGIIALWTLLKYRIVG